MANFTATLDSWIYSRSYDRNDFLLAQANLDTHAIHANVTMGNGMCYCTQDGHFYVLDNTDNQVEEYDAAWTHQAGHAVAGGSPMGITWDGNHFFVLDADGTYIYEYDADFTLQESHDISGDLPAMSFYYSIGYFNNYFYVYGYTAPDSDWIKKYDTSFTLISTTNIGYAIGDFAPGTTYLYILDGTNDDIKLYDADLSLQYTFNINHAFTDTPHGLARDRDGKLFILDKVDGGNDAVEEFEDLPPAVTINGHSQSFELLSTAATRIIEFASAQTSGVIEFWMRSTDCTKYSKAILKDATGNSCITVKIDADKIYAEATDTGLSPADYSWYRFTIDFDCTANTFDLDVDGVSETVGTAFGTNDDGSGLTQINFVKEDDTFDAHVADIGVDWDDDYDEGDNASDDADITSSILDLTIREFLYQTSTAEMTFESTISSYFQAGRTVTFKDLNAVTSWKGRILSPEYVRQGKTKSVGKTKLVGMDSQFQNSYRKNFTTARASDYMLKYIIDNHLTHYHSYDDEIDDFSALTFKYDLKKRIWSFIYFLAMLERAVIHYLPGGEVIFNAHDNLSSTGLSWVHESTSSVKIVNYVPNANRYVTRAPVIGAHNSDGQIYVVGTGSDQTEAENTHGIAEMQPWRDAELTNYSEANQLAANLQAIFSADTQFVSVLTKGKGHVQVGYTVHFASSGMFEVDEDDYLVIGRTWKPAQDVSQVVLSDNIVPQDKFHVNIINKVYDDEAQAGFEDSDISETTADGTVESLWSLQQVRRVLDEDDLASDSDDHLATQQSIKAYVDAGGGGGLSDIVDDATPQLGGELDVNGKGILLNDDLGSDHTYEGIVVELTNAQSFGKAVYISANNTVAQADADATTTMPCIGISVGTNKVLVWGTIRDDSWSWTAGDILYVSTTAGSLTTTAPSGSGDQVQVVGVAISSAEVLVIPSMVLVEVA